MLSPVADFLCRFRAELVAGGATTIEDSIGCVRAFVLEDEELIATRLRGLGQPEELARRLVERGDVCDAVLAALAVAGPEEATSRETPVSMRRDDLARDPRWRRHRHEDEKIAALARRMHDRQPSHLKVVARGVFLAHHPDLANELDAVRWVVITGNRLHAAAQLAGLTQLDVMVHDHLGGHDPRLSEATLLERLHHEALPPLLEARELQALVDRHGSQSAVATRLGKSQPWVSQRLALLRLSTEMQDALEREEITIREARRVAIAAPRDQVRALDELRAAAARLPPGAASPSSTPRCPAPAPPADVDDPHLGTASGATGPGAGVQELGQPERPDLGRIARDLRTRLTHDERSHLVQLLRPGGDDVHRNTVVSS